VIRPTKQPAIVQLPQGSSLIPSSFGRAYIMYNSTRKPGDSIVAHPIFPGMFHLDSVDVLPCGYQSSTHCAVVICAAQDVSKDAHSLTQGVRTYNWEVCPDATYKLPILARWRKPILNNSHGSGAIDVCVRRAIVCRALNNVWKKASIS
jgi:hypothetical protein